MNTLIITDLFRSFGHGFDYQRRIDDQNKLIERLSEIFAATGIVAFDETATELHDFNDEGPISLNYIELVFLPKLTKTCAIHNVKMA